MASPFSIFRKNQKVMIAVLGVLAMFAFVFLPIIMQGMGGRSTTDPVVLKTTKFGGMRKSYLQFLQNSHLRVLSVLGQLQAMGDVGAAVAAGKISEETAKAIQDRYAGLYRQQFERILGRANPADVAKLWLLARQAEQTGMVISDEMIRTFVKEITQDVVKTADIQAVFAHAGLSAQQFFDLMRDELLALQLRSEFNVSISMYATTPGQRWDYFNRVNRMATIEAVPVAVADYVKKVADPKEEILKDFFEKNKERYPNPESSEPGFRRPHKVAIEYFRADCDKFASPQTVTDAEIQQEYEKHKDLYDRFIEKPEEKGPAEKAERKEPQKPVEKKEQRPAENKKQTPPEKSEKKIDSKGEKKDSKGVSSIISPLPLGEGQGVRASRASNQSPFALTAFAEDKKTDDKPQPTAKAAEPVKEPAAGAKQGKPADKMPAVVTGPHPNPLPKGEGTRTEPPKSGLPGLPNAILPDLPKGNLPGLPNPVLSEAMKNHIRRGVARERILKVFEGLRVLMDQYGQEWSKYDVERITSQDAAGEGQKPLGSPPPRPDFSELAKQNRLTADHTGLIAQWEAQNLPIGISQPAQVVEEQLRVSGGAPVWQYAFQSIPAFRPAISADGDGLYLFWKTKDEKEHVPKFDDEGVRDEALLAWKMIEARKLAFKQAKSLAAEAEKAQKPLKQVFADLHVALPPKFSWMTFGNVASLQPAQYARLSSVAGVEMAGEEFMRTVFGLNKPGEVAVAFNAPKTVAYVVRLNEFGPAYEVRKDLFQVDDFRKYAAVGTEDQKQMERAWLKEIEASAGFDWTPGHNPEQTSDSGEPSSPHEDQPWED